MHRILRNVLIMLCYLLGVSQPVFSQVFGNEWIDENQSYYRIRLSENGIYRINQSDLNAAGIPLGTIDPRRIQLFHRGVEQAIHIEGQQDGSFDPSDFIEFYGQVNNGENETSLYTSPNAQPHTRYSLFSDSSAYFLTWRLSPINGKRVTVFSENNVDAISADNYHYGEDVLLNTNNYSAGTSYSNGNVLLSQFDIGEGWTGSDIANGNTGTFTLSSLSNQFRTGPDPRLKLVMVGRNNLSHNIEIRIGPNTSSLRLLTTAEFVAHDIFDLEIAIDWNDIDINGTFVLTVTPLGVAGAADRIAVSLIDVDFPQTFDMVGANSKTFSLEVNPGNKSYIEVTNSPGSIRLYDITDPGNIVRIGVNQGPSDFNAVVPITATTRKLIAYQNPLSSFVIRSTSFQEIELSNDYIILSHPQLQQTTNGGEPDPIDQYKQYRESTIGGSHNVGVYSILTLYDQFNFGEPSPLAIRNMTNYLLSNGNLQYIFIIGEALDVPNNPDRQTEAELSAQGIAHLVPTMGFPGSDIALIAGLMGTDVVAPIPIGRITASTPDQVLGYLNKVKEYEQTSFDDLWKKRIIHLSGGTTPIELLLFRGHVDVFKSIAEGDHLGGSVTTNSKQFSSPIELFNVSDAVNDGVGLITFFGHSGPNGSDIDIGRVSNPSFGYNNKGLYNTILVNGCNAGDVFGQFFSLGEDWILTPDKGSVLYMAHSDNGLSTQLRRYSQKFYEVGYGDSTFIDRTIGEIKLETGKRYVADFSNTPVERAQVQQFILQGDPATTLFGATLPDYDITANDISFSSFDGEPITSLTDSFSVDVIVRNFGRTTTRPLEITINRFLSDGSTETFGPEIVSPVRFQDTLSITVRSISSESSFGNNRFEVILDERNLTEELNELNNRASTDFFISSGTTINVFPKNFGVESQTTVRFISQSSDLLSESRGYLFELDTTRAFNSPLFIQRAGNFKVLAAWDINLPFTPNDTIVYYWRSKFTEIREGEEDVFAESSFTYIPDSPDGWAQSSFNQFDLLTADGLIKNEITDQWNFVQTQLSTRVKTHGTTHFLSNPVLYDSLEVNLDGNAILRQDQGNFICRSNSLNAIALDRSSLFAYLIFGINTGGNDPQKCGTSPFIINNFIESDISGASLKFNSYIDNVVDGDFILIFSIGELQYDSWPAEVISKLNTIGVNSSFLSSLTPGQPIIILGQKGASPGNAIEISGASSDKISFDQIISGNFTEGSLTTPRIGPASVWNSFFRAATNISTDDNFSYDIIGVNRQGTEDLLFTGLTNDNQDISSILTSEYPFLRLKFNTQNVTSEFPSQLNKWQISFEGVPEGILLTNDPNIQRENTLSRSEGEPLETNYYFKNISKLDFSDSLLIRLSTFNLDSRESFVDQIKIPPLDSNDSVDFSYNIETLGKSGLNDLNVFVNPEGSDEVSLNNNIIDISDFVLVNPDETNPVLDVTFDGVYILDGDIVSPSPRIVVKVKDENPFLFKNDTTGLELALKVPCDGCDFQRVNFTSPDILITAADDNTDFQIEYHPKDLTDGVYSLQIQGSDFSGNASAIQPYEISFEVINESTITHFYPYPNPFSTSTRFVFTLTGSEIPDQIKIQIMTVSGKIVREITQDEIGPINIGNNLTEYAWDGRDEYGDQLANGVYLYRVVLRKNGEKMERRKTSADKAFKNGFGKLYLLR